MKVNITIPDATFDIYAEKYPGPKVYEKFKEAIELCKDIEVNDRVLMLNGDTRRAIEAVFQTTVDDTAKLLRQIKMLNEVSVQDIAIEFTPEELVRLDAQAGFHGRTRKQFIIEMVNELKGTMLETF